MQSGLSRFLEVLFGGNMIEGTIKSALWILAFCCILAWTV